MDARTIPANEYERAKSDMLRGIARDAENARAAQFIEGVRQDAAAVDAARAAARVRDEEGRARRDAESRRPQPFRFGYA